MKIVSIQRWFGALALVGLTLAVGVGCGGDDGDSNPPPGDVLGDCPPGASTTAGQTLVNNRCATAGCHAAPVSNPNAPDLSTEAMRIEHAVHMFEAASAGDMPPGAPLPSSELEDLRVYLACITQ